MLPHKKPEKLYPLRFTPIFKEKLWGGQGLKKFLHKPVPQGHIGESWEISTVKNNQSVVANGPLAGQKLNDLVKTFEQELIGKPVFKRYGTDFPLLVKFIDARKNLSVQLHPEDELALKRHNSFGKAEMWHILKADDSAYVISGLKKGTTKEIYLNHLKKRSLPEILNKDYVTSGDSIYIKPGLVHSIGKGIILAEIQQTSDITYRIYDWERKDQNGKKRELHTDLALDAIDFKNTGHSTIKDITCHNQNEELIENEYFKTTKLKLRDHTYQWQDSSMKSFSILICTKGQFLLSGEGFSERLSIGETVLIPACITYFSMKATNADILMVNA